MKMRAARLLTVALAAVGCDVGRRLSPERDLDASVLAVRTSARADLTVSPFLVGMSLSWLDQPNETSFRVWRSTTGSSGTFTVIATTGENVTTYSDTAIAARTEYCYKVEALQKARVAKTTSTVCATSIVFGPSPAYDLVAAWSPPNGIALTWRDSTSQLGGYRIERGISPTGGWTFVAKVGATVTAYNDYNGQLEQLICYRVIAFDETGDAKPSNVSCTVLAAPPTNVIARSPDGHTIDVTWTDASVYEDNYRVRRSTDGANYAPIATLPANTASYHDVGLTSGTRYWYIIDAMRGNAFTSSPSATAVPADVPPIEAPVLIRADPFSASSVGLPGSAVALEWTPVTNASGYYLDRSLDNLATWQRVTANIIGAVFYDYYGPTPEQLVCYRVVAYNDRGQSPTSAPRCTTPPAAPGNFFAALVDEQTVDFSWTDNSSAEDAYEIYNVLFDDIGNPLLYLVARLPSNTTTYRLTGLAPFTDYTFQVFARRDGGWSDGSGYAYISTGGAPSSTAVSFRVVRGQRMPSSWQGPVGVRR